MADPLAEYTVRDFSVPFHMQSMQTKHLAKYHPNKLEQLSLGIEIQENPGLTL